jgi:hypothetical protein
MYYVHWHIAANEVISCTVKEIGKQFHQVDTKTKQSMNLNSPAGLHGGRDKQRH